MFRPRHFLPIALASITAVALFASPGSAKTTITFWTHSHPPMVELNEKLIAEFEALHPDIDVEYTVVPNNQFFTKMLTAMGTGTGPDVLNMSSSHLPTYVANGTVTPVVPEAFGLSSQDELENAWMPGSLESAKFGGKVYGIPSEFNVSALAMNAAHFQEVGLDPNDPPETWDEVVDYSKKLVQRRGNRLMRRGFDFYYAQNFYWIDFQNLLGQYGGHVLSEDGTEAALNSEEGVAALSFWYDLVYEEKIAGAQYSFRDSVDPVADFTNGALSMFIVYPWSVGTLQDSPIWSDVKIVPLPQVDPDNPVTHQYGYFWLVNDDSEHKEAAWEFVSFLADHPTQWLTEVGFLQPKKGWIDDPAAQSFPFLDVWADSIEHADAGDRSVAWSEIAAAIQRAIESSIMSGTPPQEALDQAKREIDAALQQ